MTWRTLGPVLGLITHCLAGPAAAQCPPNTPSNLTVTSTCTEIQLNWDNETGADHYKVYRNQTNDMPAVAMATPNNSNYTDLTPLPGETYHYWVTAVNNLCLPGDRESGARHTTGTRGDDPASVTGIDASDGTDCFQVHVTWNSVLAATTYRVYRAPAGSPFEDAEQRGVAQVNTSFDDLASPGNLYRYWVVASNVCGDSLHPNSDNGYAGTLPPVAPANLAATGICGGIELTWDSVPGADQYRVYRNQTNDMPAVWFGLSNDTNYTDVTALAEQTYHYWVTAVNNLCVPGGHEGGASHAAGIRGDDPGAVTEINASDGTDCFQVHVTWNSAPGAATYRVYRGPVGSQFEDAEQRGVAQVNTSFDDDVLPDVHYTYWVVSSNVCGDSLHPHSDNGYGGSAPPQNVMVTRVDPPAGDPFLRVDWDSSPLATSYEVRSGGSDVFDDGESRGNQATSSFIDTVACVDRPQYYWVKALGVCDSDWSNPDGINEEPPVTLTAGQSSCTYVPLAWNGVSNAFGWTVFRGGVFLGQITQDWTAVLGLHYPYWVIIHRADSCGLYDTSSNSAEGWRGDADAPTGVTATYCTVPGGVDLAWNVSTGATLYRVYRSGAEIAQTTGLSWHDVPPNLLQSYTYWVAAEGENPSCAPASSSSVVGRAGATPSPPTGVAATDGTRCANVRITWSAVSFVTGYEVFRDGTSIATPTSPAFNDSTAVPGQMYVYQVRAVGVCGPGDLSGPDSGFRPDALSITGHPQAQALEVCQNAQFVITTAGGGPLTYQWRRDGANLSDGVTAGGSTVAGATSATLTILQPTLADAGAYDCVVTDSCGSVISDTAALTVQLCTASDPCRDVGVCETSTGACSNPAKPDGSACDDGNACTANDACSEGTCGGVAVPSPAEVDDGVRLSRTGEDVLITWNPSSGATGIDVARGLLDGFPVGTGGSDEVCLADNASVTSVTDGTNPASGAGFWYLIRGENNCGVGSYGSQGLHGVPSNPRATASCP